MNSLKRYRIGRGELPASVVRRVLAQRDITVATRRERQPCDGELTWLMCFECDHCEANDEYLDWQEDETFREYEARKAPKLLTVKLGEVA